MSYQENSPKPLAELQEVAQEATRKALEEYAIPDEVREKLVLGTYFQGDERVFELYVPGYQPEDARVLTRATVNAMSGEVNVELFVPHGWRKG
jgi:hypothetical protein